MIQEIDGNGFALIPDVIAPDEIAALQRAMDHAGREAGGHGEVHGLRNILEQVPEVTGLCRSPAIRTLLNQFSGAEYFPVRGIFFDKPFRANWKVVWHQDLTIAVNEKRELPGYGPWTRKSGVVHVQPPQALLQDMLTLRIHLDDCLETNGALRVLPGGHANGILKHAELKALMEREGRRERICEIRAGGILLMRPLLPHSSRASAEALHAGARRRVIHLEFARRELPDGLQWHAR